MRLVGGCGGRCRLVAGEPNVRPPRVGARRLAVLRNPRQFLVLGTSFARALPNVHAVAVGVANLLGVGARTKSLELVVDERRRAGQLHAARPMPVVA